MNTAVKAAVLSVIVFGGIVGAILFLQMSGSKPPRVGVDGSPTPDLDRGTDEEAGSPGTTAPIVIAEENPVDVTVEVTAKGTGQKLSRSRILVVQRMQGSTMGKLVRDLSNPETAGMFTFQLSPGIYDLRAQCPGYTSAKDNFTIIKDSAPVRHTFELTRGNSISGRVLAKGGGPIAGARVYAFRELGSPNADLEESLQLLIKLEEFTGEQAVVAETYSGADGYYQLDGLESSWFTVRAAADGFSPNEVENVPAPREEVDVLLDEGSLVEGIVSDTAGRRVEGARVQAYIELEGAGIFDVILSKSRPPVDEVTTDGAGKFQLRKVGPGLYNFLVDAHGYQQLTEMKSRVTPGKNPPKEFRLEPGYVLRGVVRGPNDEPIEGASVRASPVGGARRPGEQVRIKFGDGSIETDVNGMFAFDTLTNASYMLLAWHKNYKSLQRKNVRPTLDRGEEIVLRMEPGAQLKGVVVDSATGNPVPGAVVSASDLSNIRKEGVTDESGLYEIYGLGASQREITLYVKADGYARLRDRIKLEAGQVATRDFELDPTGSVDGSIVNSDGAGIAGARVEVRRQRQGAGTEQIVGHGSTNSTGAFSIADVEPGESLRLRIKKSPYLETFGTEFALDPGERVTLEQVVLQLGGTIEGKVTNENGQPIAGVILTARREGDTEIASTSPSVTVQTNNRGEFAIQGLKSGAYDVEAKGGPYLEEVKPAVAVVEGQRNIGQDIVLRSGGYLEGAVFDGSGEPIQGAEVTVRDFSEGLKELRGVSGVDGRFRVGNIAAQDTVEVEVRHRDYGPFLQQNVPVGTVDLRVVLGALGIVQGVVVDPDRRPVTSFTVQPQPEGNATREQKRLRASTFNPADGRFEYRGIPDGIYTVHVRSPLFAASSIEGIEVVAGQIAELGEIVLSEGGLISGKVVEAATDLPVAGANVRVTQGAARFTEPGSRTYQTTAADGTFSFSGVKEGSVTLEVTHANFVRKRVENVDTKIAEKSQGLVIALEQGAAITGLVVDASGRPRPGIPVYLMAKEGNSRDNRHGKSDRDGRFEFSGIGPGRYVVKAHKFQTPDGEPPLMAEQEVDLVAGGAADAFLQLVPRRAAPQ